MFKVLMLQMLYTLSDDQTEYQIRDRLSFMRFLGLALEERVPDAKTIWLVREQPTKTGAVQRPFEGFDAALCDAGYLAMVGPIVDATVIQARRPRGSAGARRPRSKVAAYPRRGRRPSGRRWIPSAAGCSSVAAGDRLTEAESWNGSRPRS
jgi:IS5 family transposase